MACNKERKWAVKSSEENINGVSEEKKLELRLGPPGEERAALVGWPPVRSFRKNLGSCSKPAPEDPDSNCPKTVFVKINMDGIPIGRKVDVMAYDGYEKLSVAVDELFRGLVAARSDGGKVVKGLLGNREYTLVYEDNEGDRMLVGDVPWHMFVSTVKRLRVLKSSQLPT